jgi:hypothetical protein
MESFTSEGITGKSVRGNEALVAPDKSFRRPVYEGGGALCS